MNKKEKIILGAMILSSILIISYATFVIAAEVIITDPKITIDNCASCYDNDEIGFDYNSYHYKVARYDPEGDRILDKEKLLEIAKAQEYNRLNSKTETYDTKTDLRVMEIVK